MAATAADVRTYVRQQLCEHAAYKCVHVPEKTINLEQKRGDPCIQSEEFLLSLISHVQNRRTFMHLGHMFA